MWLAGEKVFNIADQKGQEITNVGKDAEKKESLYTVGGNISWCSHSGIQYAEPSKKLKNRAII